MALIFADTTCPICNEKLDRPYTATSGAAFPREHPLWLYCDAPLHFDCLESWPHRIEFSQAYFNLAVQHYESGHGYLLKKDADWILATGPCAAHSFPYFAEARLREWPFRLYSPWIEWDKFVSGEYRNNLVGRALRVAEQTMGEIIKIAPDHAILTRLLEQKRH